MFNIDILESMTELNSPVQHADPFTFPNHSDWFLIFEQYVASNNDHLKIYHLRSQNGLDSLLLPLVQKRSTAGAVLLQSLQNYYTVDYRPICSTEDARSLISEVISNIANVGSIDQVELMPLDVDAPETHILMRAFESAGWKINTSSYQVNWVHAVQGTYEQYLNERPKRLRNTIRRKSNRLLAMPGAELFVSKGEGNLEDLVTQYSTVYNKSWKNDEPHPKFIPALIELMAQRGYLRLGILKIESVPIAVHFWIVIGQKAYIYKLAHDSAYDNLSPGTVLMAEMVKHVIESDKVRELDFLSGDDEYKKDWMDNRREKIVLRAYNNKSIRGIFNYYLKQRFIPIMRQVSKTFRAASLSR